MSELLLSPLQSLIEPLAEFEYDAEHQPAGEASIYETLFITLDIEEDRPERNYTIEVFFINDVTEAFGDEEAEEDAVIAQFTLILPFRIRVESYLEILRFCTLVNRLTPMGTFGLSENDEAVYLRYCLATESRSIPPVVLLEVVSALEFCCKEYGPLIEELSNGTRTYDDHIAAFEATGRQLPSVGNPDLYTAEAV